MSYGGGDGNGDNDNDNDNDDASGEEQISSSEGMVATFLFNYQG